MAAEFVVAGRRALPAAGEPWQFELQNSEGGVALCEPGILYDASGCESVASQVAEVVGWTPGSIVFVRRAWELAQVVAEELAGALDGAVYCDVDNEVFFDARGGSSPAGSRRELEERLERSFNHPQPFFERWQKEEKARLEVEAKGDPSVADGGGWSDLG